MAASKQPALLPGMVDSPTRKALGIRYLYSGPDWLEAQFKPSPRFCNHVGSAQGGLLGMFLDNVMGQCCHMMAGPEKVLTTTQLSLYFLAPAPMSVLKCRAQVVKRGQRLFVVEGTVLDQEGNALVRAVASMMVMGRPRSAALAKPEPPA